jgi:hypothetical protein
MSTLPLFHVIAGPDHVIAGSDPAIRSTWMPGSSPGMTEENFRAARG